MKIRFLDTVKIPVMLTLSAILDVRSVAIIASVLKYGLREIRRHSCKGLRIFAMVCLRDVWDYEYVVREAQAPEANNFARGDRDIGSLVGSLFFGLYLPTE
jgi:hypothetical protein